MSWMFFLGKYIYNICYILVYNSKTKFTWIFGYWLFSNLGYLLFLYLLI